MVWLCTPNVTVTSSSLQDRLIGLLLAELPEQRLGPYLRDAKGNARRALALYYWNIEACRAFYPALQALEVGLRNGLDKAIVRYVADKRLLTGRAPHPEIQSWLTADQSSLIVHEDARRAVASAVDGVLPKDSQGKVVRHNKNHGDLVAKLSFGFWVSLLAEEYDAAYRYPAALAWWPSHQAVAFPASTGIDMRSINRQFSEIRHFRNRVFHHEPIWPKYPTQPTVDQRYTTIMDALRLIGGAQSQIPPILHGRPAEFDAKIEEMEGRLKAAVEVQLERASRKAKEKEERKRKREEEKALKAAKREGARLEEATGSADPTGPLSAS